MTAILEKSFFSDVQKQKEWPVYFFYGEESFKVEEAINLIEKKVGLEKEYIKTFYGSDFQKQDFSSELQNFSLFATKKLLLISEAERISMKDWDAIIPLLEAENPDVTILFQATQLDKRKKFAKWMTRSKQVAMVDFQYIRPQELGVWTKKLAKKRKKKVSPAAIESLQNLLGLSLTEVDQAIEKAALYSGKASEIEAKHVEATSTRIRQDVVFSLTDALLQGNRERALQQLSYLLEQGEEAIAIVALLARQYRWLQAIYTYQSAGYSRDQAMQELKLYPKIAQNLFGALRRIGKQGVENALQKLEEADLALKSTMEPKKLILDRLLLSLSTR